MGRTEISQIYELVGESTTLWNEVETLWYLIYTGLMRDTDRAVVDTIYGLFHANARQRELIVAIAPSALRYDETKWRRDPAERTKYRLAKRIGQLHARTNDLAGVRNAITHSGFEMAAWIVPQRVVAASPHAPSKLAGSEILPTLQRQVWEVGLLVLDLADFRDDLIELGEPDQRPEALRRILGIQQLVDGRKTERKRLQSLLDGA